MKAFATIAFALAALLAVPAHAQSGERSGRCALVVDGRSYIAGPCRYTLEPGGSFSLRDLRGPDYFAYVTVDGDRGEGWWNETRGAGHAHTPLGPLTRHGACWENKRARVCAWAK